MICHDDNYFILKSCEVYLSSFLSNPFKSRRGWSFPLSLSNWIKFDSSSVSPCIACPCRARYCKYSTTFMKHVWLDSMSFLLHHWTFPVHLRNFLKGLFHSQLFCGIQTLDALGLVGRQRLFPVWKHSRYKAKFFICFWHLENLILHFVACEWNTGQIRWLIREQPLRKIPKTTWIEMRDSVSQHSFFGGLKSAGCNGSFNYTELYSLAGSRLFNLSLDWRRLRFLTGYCSFYCTFFWLEAIIRVLFRPVPYGLAGSTPGMGISIFFFPSDMIGWFILRLKEDSGT